MIVTPKNQVKMIKALTMWINGCYILKNVKHCFTMVKKILKIDAFFSETGDSDTETRSQHDHDIDKGTSS